MVRVHGGAVIVAFELLLLQRCFLGSRYTVAAEVDCVGAVD